MDERTKDAYVKEVKFQMKMLQNLKRWIRNMMILSSIALALILFGANLHQALKVIGVTLMVISLGATLLLGWTIKKGTYNLGLLLGKKTLQVHGKN